ncbi:MAG: hypothetical protein R3324_00450, partial [Halobacteriales archaeon]|nr:hypothetical protein [Halobacteriales archaeon]
DVVRGPVPKEDIPNFLESPEADEWIASLHEVMYENGFTLNSDLTRFEGTGYVATITSDNYQHPSEGGEGISKQAIVDLYERMLPVLEAFPNITKLGTFYGDGGYMSVDLNIVTEDRELAVAIGQANNQQAIWDLNEMAPIATGGDGESPIDASDPQAVLSFVEDLVDRGREAKALAGLIPGEAPRSTMTEYETDTGDRVNGIVLFGKLKSGAWRLIDTRSDGPDAPEQWAVETEDGQEVILTPVEPEPQKDLADGEDGGITDPFENAPATDYTAEEEAFHSMYVDVLWDEDDGRELLGAVSRLPDSVREQLITALEEDPLFEDFATITVAQRANLREWLVRQARDDGWTISGLAEQLGNIAPDTTRFERERIARTETQSWVTHAREKWYREDFEAEEEALFIWQGPEDHRTTEACSWLKDQTNPQYGGTPRTLDELQGLVEEAQAEYFPDLDTRRWTVHPYERHTIVRYYNV